MSNELQTEQQPVEAVRPVIKAGRLRERVKKGELQAKDVLAWLKEQEGPISEEFVTWLRNFKPNRGKKVEKVEEVKEEKPKKRFRKGGRNGRSTGRRSNQNFRRKPDGQDHKSSGHQGSGRPDPTSTGTTIGGKDNNPSVTPKLKKE